MLTADQLNGSSAQVVAQPSHNYKIASIPADGIGPEVVSAAIEVVKKLSETMKTFTIDFEHIPWGTAYYKETGKYVDDDVLERLKTYDAALFGSVGAPGTSHIPFRSLLAKSLTMIQTFQTTSHFGVYYSLFVDHFSSTRM